MPKYLVSSGSIAWVGALTVIMADIVGILLQPKHNPISDTISMLAVGPWGWVQDIGIDALGLGLIALAFGLFHWNLDGRRWTVGTSLVALMGLDLFIIAHVHGYADSEGFNPTIHLIAVSVLYLLFIAAGALLAKGLFQYHRACGRAHLAIVGIWTVIAPVFYYVTRQYSGVDGLVERTLALVFIAWTAMIASVMIRHGKTSGKVSAVVH